MSNYFPLSPNKSNFVIKFSWDYGAKLCNYCSKSLRSIIYELTASTMDFEFVSKMTCCRSFETAQVRASKSAFASASRTFSITWYLCIRHTINSPLGLDRSLPPVKCISLKIVASTLHFMNPEDDCFHLISSLAEGTGSFCVWGTFRSSSHCWSSSEAREILIFAGLYIHLVP